MGWRKNVSLFQRVGEVVGRHDQRIRIAVVGAQECGKTMFLVSLINHLLKADFDNIGEWGLSAGAEISSPRCASGIKPFDYERYRTIYEALFGIKDGKPCNMGSVPPSTLETYLLQMKVPLGRQKNDRIKSKKVLLEVLDVPGERVADFSMFRRTYKEWCREIIHAHRMVPGGSPAFDKYISEASKAQKEVEIKEAYFNYVKNRSNGNSTLIYPSTILLDSCGKKIEKLEKGNHPFFTGAEFFAPLPDDFLKDKSKRKIVEAFGRAYKEYCRASGVNDICGWLETANKVYYLLDVFSILMAGKDREDDMRSHVVEALKMFGSRERNIIRRVCDGIADFMMRSRADEVYLVGTQIDRAARSQRDNVKKLLEHEFNAILQMPALAGKFCEIKTCAAIRFGQDDGDDATEGSFKDSPHEEKTFETTKHSNKVPIKFPDDYSYVVNDQDQRQLKYAYPYYQPRFGGDERKVYDHIAFDEIVKTIFATHSDMGR